MNEWRELLPYLMPHERAEIATHFERLSTEQVEEYRNFTTYKGLIYKSYKHAPHLVLLDSYLQQVELYIRTQGVEGIGRLIVELPPRHSKTMSVSKLFPSWVMGRNPDKRIMLVSYGASLAEKNSRYVRNTINKLDYQRLFPGVRLSKDSAAVDAWDLEGYEGGCDALGIEGAATGKGAHLLICDDILKGRKTAESALQRDNIWETYSVDLYSRLEPGAAIIMVGTRWHIDDPVGRILKAEVDPDVDEAGERWIRLRLPALAEEDDPLKRQVGEALWPWRYPVERLLKIRGVAGEYNWNALYQQRPVPAEGGLFKRANFNLIPSTAVGELSYAARFWDLAMSSKTSADYSAGVLMGQGQDGRIKVLDVVRRQVEWDELAALMADTALRDGPGVMIGFEQAGYMSRAGQALSADPRLHHYGIWGYPKDKDKFTNALNFASRVGLKVVDVVEAQWTGNYLDELCSFDRGAHDDQVDASAGAYEMLDGGLPSESGLNYADEYTIG